MQGVEAVRPACPSPPELRYRARRAQRGPWPSPRKNWSVRVPDRSEPYSLLFTTPARPAIAGQALPLTEDRRHDGSPSVLSLKKMEQIARLARLLYKEGEHANGAPENTTGPDASR